MAPSSRRRRSRSREGLGDAVDKRDQTATAVSAFKTLHVSELATAQQEQDQKRKVLPAAVRFKAIEQEKSASGYTELLAFSGDNKLGYALVEERPNGELYLELVLTFPPYRGQSVGGALLREVERYGRSKGYRRLTGEVSVNDYTSSPTEIARRARWFEALGFKVNKVVEHRWTLAKAL